jgi:hypothetical protein
MIFSLLKAIETATSAETWTAETYNELKKTRYELERTRIE